MLLDGAVVLVVGPTTGLDFILLQLISTHCRVYITGPAERSVSFVRAASRIRDAQLRYLSPEDSSASDSESEDEDGSRLYETLSEFLRLESRLDLVIFSTVDNVDKSIKQVLPVLMSTADHHGSSNIILLKTVHRRPRTRMDSLKKVRNHSPTMSKGHRLPMRGDDRAVDVDSDDDDNDNNDDAHAEDVKASLLDIFSRNHAENIFVNAASLDQLLPAIMQYDQYRESHQVAHPQRQSVVSQTTQLDSAMV
ncbi:hypothetical protein BZA70DRAFT_272402 [Myxozyma melibiosi]|uniref:Uncharacterized protein n=1 Tax=Myxozyma melibiosi TaxID=54550 RepID=A0ABR1FDG3_9ASCO